MAVHSSSVGVRSGTSSRKKVKLSTTEDVGGGGGGLESLSSTPSEARNSSRLSSGIISMDSDLEEYEDSGNASSGEEVDFAMERDDRPGNARGSEDEYPFTVLTTKDIVDHMVESIREVCFVM